MMITPIQTLKRLWCLQQDKGVRCNWTSFVVNFFQHIGSTEGLKLIAELSLLKAVRIGRLVAGICVGAVVLSACETTYSGSNSNGGDGAMQGLQSTLYMSAREAEGKNDYDKAAGIYARLTEQRANDPVMLIGFIRNMRYSGNQSVGVQYVEQHAEYMLQHDDVKFEYGKALLADGQYERALSNLQETAQALPDNWKVYSAMGVAYDAMNRYDDAMQAYAQALRISPNNAVVLNNKAMSQAMAGHLDAAIGTLKRAAEINRHNVSIRQNLALMYAINGDLASAKALTAMDLQLDEVETNMSFYSRFKGGAQ